MATTTEAISYLKLAGEVYCKSSVTDDLCNTSKEYIMTAYVNQWQIKVRTANWTNWVWSC